MPVSVQCPRCQAAVAVGDDAGGTRVICPNCTDTFLVPGAPASVTNDDDDWLSLDEPAPTPVVVAPAAPITPASISPGLKPNPAAGNSSSGQSSSGQSSSGQSGSAPSKPDGDSSDDDLFAMDLPPLAPVKPRPSSLPDSLPFDDDPDDPFSLDSMEPESVKAFPGAKPATPTPTPSSSTVDPLFAQAAALVASSSAKASTPDDGIDEPVAHNVEYETDYRVRCPLCGSPSDVKASQAGSQIRCQDCHKMIKVPPAPRKKKKLVIDMDGAETFQFNESAAMKSDRPADPFRKSAQEYLDAAARVEEESPPPNYDVPKISDWAKAVFGIFGQIGVTVHWLILSSIASVFAFFAIASENPVALMALFPAGIFFAAMVLACGFTILQSVSNDEPEVSEWPLTLEPMEWIAPMVFCFAAVGLTGGPGWFLGHMAFGESLATVCLVMLSTFLLFPFVLLSMLDMQNMFVPFSAEVGRSITRCEEAWGGFYLSSGLIFFAIFMVFAVASVIAAPAAAVVCVFTATAGTFIYFAMLGRLARAIGHSVNEKPRDNDIDEVREAERKRAAGGG